MPRCRSSGTKGFYVMTGTNEFTTERLLMRRYRMDDAAVLYERFGRDPEMYKYSGWNPYSSHDMAQSTVQRFMESYALPDFYGWAVEYENRLIGTVGAYDYDPERNSIEVGLSIDPDFWGNGFATEALTGVLKYLTDHEGIDVITAWCASENAASERAMQKAGMKQTAMEKDALEVDGIQYDKLVYEFVKEK